MICWYASGMSVNEEPARYAAGKRGQLACVEYVRCGAASLTALMSFADMGERSQSIVPRCIASNASVNSMLVGTAPKWVAADCCEAAPMRTCLFSKSSAVAISELQLSE